MAECNNEKDGSYSTSRSRTVLLWLPASKSLSKLTVASLPLRPGATERSAGANRLHIMDTISMHIHFFSSSCLYYMKQES